MEENNKNETMYIVNTKKETNKKETVYNAYTEEEKNRYKKIRENIDTTKKYETFIKKEKETALLSALIVLIITILIFTETLGELFSIFYFTGFYAIALINVFFLVHSVKNLKNTKLYILSIIISLINIFFSFCIMFSL